MVMLENPWLVIHGSFYYRFPLKIFKCTTPLNEIAPHTLPRLRVCGDERKINLLFLSHESSINIHPDRQGKIFFHP
jgi:hypothetical protein